MFSSWNEKEEIDKKDRRLQTARGAMEVGEYGAALS